MKGTVVCAGPGKLFFTPHILDDPFDVWSDPDYKWVRVSTDQFPLSQWPKLPKKAGTHATAQDWDLPKGFSPFS